MQRLLFLSLFSLLTFSIQAQDDYWVAPEGAIKSISIQYWTTMPTEDQIEAAKTEYVKKMPKHGSLIMAPTKYTAPWWNTPQESNKVFMAAKFKYTPPQRDVEMVLMLEKDLLDGRIYFKPIMLQGVKRYEGDRNTASYMILKDLKYLKAGWLQSTPSGGSETDPDSTLPGKVPCREALAKFNLPAIVDPKLRYDYQDLYRQFDDAIKLYEKNNSGKKVFVQDNIAGTIPALTWLVNQGGTADPISRQFIFTTNQDRENFKKLGRYARENEVTRGTEPALYYSVYNYSKQLNRKLNPGDLLYLALKERDGNIKEAMLLAHNMLRSMARIVVQPITGNNDQDLTLVFYQPGFIKEYFEPMVLGSDATGGGNTGAWYHIFGTSYFELQARGTWGAYTAVQWTVDELGDRLTRLAAEINIILSKDPELKTPANQTAYSSLSNEIEQVARVYVFGSQEDPLKYCYNVWGAQLAAWLYKERVARYGLGNGVPLPMPPADISNPTIFGPNPLQYSPYQKIRTVISSSPLNITWQGEGGKMMLDQKTENLYGYFPTMILPYYEKDTKTWGMMWIESQEKPYLLSLEGSQDGWAHITMIEDGKVSVWPIALKKGEKMSLLMDTTLPPSPIVNENGAILDPIPVRAQSGDEIIYPTSEVLLKGHVIDKYNSAKVIGALVVILRPGYSTDDWKHRGFSDDLVLMSAITDENGSFALPSTLQKNTRYALAVIREFYQPFLMDDFVLDESTPLDASINVTLTPDASG